MSRYWSDAAYAQFYQTSTAERGLAKSSAAPSDKRVDGSGLWTPDRKQLEIFQQAFAEWSGGQGGLRVTDFRQFLIQIGVELSAKQARQLWNDFVPDGEQRLGYEQSLLAYRQVMNAPLSIRAPAGTLPPGKPLPKPRIDSHSAMNLGVSMAAYAAEEERDDLEFERMYEEAGYGRLEREEDAWQRLRDQAECPRLRAGPGTVGSRGVGDAGWGGLGLPVVEARELLISEGLPPASVEALLQQYSGSGVVPQAALFEYLEEQADARDKDEPLRASAPERKAPALHAAAHPPLAPVLA